MSATSMRVARVNRGKSIRGLGREINVPEQTIRRAEKGDSISLEYAKRLADWHGSTVVDLMPWLLDEKAAA